MKRLLWGLLLCTAAWGEPDREAVWQVVDEAGLPRPLVVLQDRRSCPEVVAIGRKEAGGTRLAAVYMDGRYLSLSQATAAVLPRLNAETALAWTCEVVLAFDEICQKQPAAFETRTDFIAPEASASGPDYRVRLWLAEGKEYVLCQYTLSARGVRRTTQQRVR